MELRALPPLTVPHLGIFVPINRLHAHFAHEHAPRPRFRCAFAVRHNYRLDALRIVAAADKRTRERKAVASGKLPIPSKELERRDDCRIILRVRLAKHGVRDAKQHPRQGVVLLLPLLAILNVRLHREVKELVVERRHPHKRAQLDRVRAAWLVHRGPRRAAERHGCAEVLTVEEKDAMLTLKVLDPRVERRVHALRCRTRRLLLQLALLPRQRAVAFARSAAAPVAAATRLLRKRVDAQASLLTPAAARWRGGARRGTNSRDGAPLPAAAAARTRKGDHRNAFSPLTGPRICRSTAAAPTAAFTIHVRDERHLARVGLCSASGVPTVCTVAAAAVTAAPVAATSAAFVRRTRRIAVPPASSSSPAAGSTTTVTVPRRGEAVPRRGGGRGPVLSPPILRRAVLLELVAAPTTPRRSTFRRRGRRRAAPSAAATAAANAGGCRARRDLKAARSVGEHFKWDEAWEWFDGLIVERIHAVSNAHRSEQRLHHARGVAQLLRRPRAAAARIKVRRLRKRTRERR